MAGISGQKRPRESHPQQKKKPALIVVDEEAVQVKNARGVQVWTTRVIKDHKASTQIPHTTPTPTSSRHQITVSPGRDSYSDNETDIHKKKRKRKVLLLYVFLILLLIYFASQSVPK